MKDERWYDKYKVMGNNYLYTIKHYFSFFISHFSFQQQKGYTLIELLVVIGILSVIGVMVVSVVSVTLRGSQKSEKLEVVRQSGDATLEQMVRGIRYANSLNAPASCVPATTTSSITVTSLQDSRQTVYSCNANTIASNSASLFDTSTVTVSNCSFTCSQQNVSDPPTILIQFTLSDKATSGIVESTASIPFQTSVTLRNYSR